MGSLSDGDLVTALRANRLPTFSFVIPDICHDTHDCSVGTGDAWLAQLVPQIQDSPAYRGGRTAVFIVWDEPRPMPFIVIAPTVPHGVVVGLPIDHYALLRTTEELLALDGRLGVAATAPSLRGPFGL
jgi:acid phosphatase